MNADEFPITSEDILEGDFWPEPVRILTIKPLGDSLRIEAVGTRSQQLYPRVLDLSNLACVRRITPQQRNFAGSAEAFFLAIEAKRIRNAHQFDPLMAVNVSQVDPLPHQIEAVYHFMLKSSQLRFLLADDPGAGKTIMTGLLLKELKYRGLVQRVLIVVPGHLKDQWMREMKERFDERFTVVDRGVINASFGRNIWQEESQIITSMDFAKQNDVLTALAETHWDLVVVDEAHKMAAYRYGNKTNKTERYRLGERLSSKSQYIVFLTATPHRGDPENFRLLLDLLQPGMFANTELLNESFQNKDNYFFLRRLKEDLKDFSGRPLFPPRQVFTKTYRLSDDEKLLYNAVTQYVEKSYNKALDAKKRNVAFALIILQRRMASSVRAVRRSLERRKARLEELLRLGNWLAEGGRFDEDELEDAPETERLEKEEELIERLTAAETRDELQTEIAELAELIRLAYQAEDKEIETKLAELRAVINDEHIQQTNEKLLIFTESKETLEYLTEKLTSWGYKVVKLHGAMSLDDRIRAENEFRESAQVMVSTEAGGEGINLQFCSLMVNYDLPWSPNRLEQRMGRIHRYGQQKEVHVYNLVAHDTREGQVLQALFRKLERIREAYGSDRVFDVIGDLLAGRNLKDLIVEAISNRRTIEEIVNEIQAIPDEEAVQKAKEAALEALATRHINLANILGEDRRAREQRLAPEYIECFFERACNFLGVKIERRRDGFWRVSSVPYEIRSVTQEFKNRYGEVFNEYKKLAFDKQTARNAEAVFIAPGHPLLESIIEKIIQSCTPDLQKGAIFVDPDGRLNGWLWFLECEIRDGNDQIAGKRLICIYQPADGTDMYEINSSVLWDLKPGKSTDIADAVFQSSLSDSSVMDFVVKNLLNGYRDELLKERKRDAEIKRKYGVLSIDQLINESQARLIEYETRRNKGEALPDVELRNVERRLEELRTRKQKLEADISRQTSLLPSEPRILGVACVISEDAPSDMHSDAAIEAIGMQVAMEYERQAGRTPEDVSRECLGYDIRSTAPDGTVRYIEVKARATTGPIVLTQNEWMMAQRLKDEYWLYVVENAASKAQLHAICNPAKTLESEIIELVRILIKDWKKGLAN